MPQLQPSRLVDPSAFGRSGFRRFYRKFPAIRAIYLTQDHTDDVDKGLQGSTSLVGFLVMIIGWWKEAADMINDLITQNEGLFFRCAGGHPAAPRYVCCIFWESGPQGRAGDRVVAALGSLA